MKLCTRPWPVRGQPSSKSEKPVRQHAEPWPHLGQLAVALALLHVLDLLAQALHALLQRRQLRLCELVDLRHLHPRAHAAPSAQPDA